MFVGEEAIKMQLANWRPLAFMFKKSLNWNLVNQEWHGHQHRIIANGQFPLPLKTIKYALEIMSFKHLFAS